MIELYHGSTTIVTQPQANKGRSGLDFGQGFYLTAIQAQAESWALDTKDRRQQHEAIVNVYRFDDTAARKSSLRWKRFKSYNKAWLDFIVACRNNNDEWQQYDIIEGGIANDRVITTVSLYMQKLISAREALRRLRYHEPTHQIAFISQRSIDLFLAFQQSYQIKSRSDG